MTLKREPAVCDGHVVVYALSLSKVEAVEEYRMPLEHSAGESADARR